MAGALPSQPLCSDEAQRSQATSDCPRLWSLPGRWAGQRGWHSDHNLAGVACMRELAKRCIQLRDVVLQRWERLDQSSCQHAGELFEIAL